MKRVLLLGLVILLSAAPLNAVAAGEVTSVTVGTWKPAEKGSVDHVKVDGEDIYLNGVKQEAKYQPGMNITIQDGKVVLVPQTNAPQTNAPKPAQPVNVK